MNVKSQKDLEALTATETRCAIRHPAWWDRARTANSAGQANGYRPGEGGEHRSAPVPLDLTCTFPLPSNAGEAYLTEAVAPRLCSTYLHDWVDDGEVAMPAGYAAQVLSALYMLTAADEAGRG